MGRSRGGGIVVVDVGVAVAAAVRRTDTRTNPRGIERTGIEELRKIGRIESAGRRDGFAVVEDTRKIGRVPLKKHIICIMYFKKSIIIHTRSPLPAPFYSFLTKSER